MQCIDGFSLLSQIYVRKGKDAKNSAIFSFFFVTKRAQLNAAHVKKLRLNENLHSWKYTYFSRTTH